MPHLSGTSVSEVQSSQRRAEAVGDVSSDRGDAGNMSGVTLAEKLLNWRTRPSFGWIEAVVLLAYCGVLALAIPFHEAWSDEAQAWMIARDNSLWEILRYRLHYEGAPALWHILLHTLYVLHGSYSAMGWLGGALAACGIFVMLRWSPFPLLVRILLPFTFFLQYQYAVVARSYVVFPLLTFILCALYRSRRNPLWFGLVAGLLANVSLQGVIFSGLLLLYYLFDRYRPAHTEGARPRFAGTGQFVGSAVVYAMFLAFAGVVALPAPDQVYASGQPVVHPGHLQDLLIKFPGEPPQQVRTNPPDPTLEPDPLPPAPSALRHPLQWVASYVHAEEADIIKHPDKRRPLKALFNLIFGGAAEATWPISTSKIFACVFLVVLGVWLRQHRYLRGMFPWVLLIFIGERLWAADHHIGLLLIVLLAAVWIASLSTANRAPSAALDRSFVLLLVVVCALQVLWSIVSIRADRRGNYDPGFETASFLKQHPVRNLVGFDFYTEAIQPYFAHSPFSDIPTGYWIWSLDGNPDPQHRSIIAAHPDMVVFSFDRPDVGIMHNEWAPLFLLMKPAEERDFTHNAIVNDLREHGYRETHRFCGHRFSRMSSSYESCDVIFEPEDHS